MAVILGSDYFLDWKTAMDHFQTILSSSAMKKYHQGTSPQELSAEGTTVAAEGIGRGSRKKKQRLRSRNEVVDDWLEQEDGHDAFADLEDFLVY
jgi:hypothetical protein